MGKMDHDNTWVRIKIRILKGFCGFQLEFEV
ncbi:hypothetical protein COLO4_03168 [Corchorus olitorius]|uniref:Uncharacterized protein n=1 Tax=Corchorus olitorius TaxID=93759 RepID=A0A1R3KZC8_9ROSI|nr:hypothetical protein COLO4_03168 [Corchorus olitorius]